MTTEALTGSVSRSRMEEELPTIKIKRARDVVQAMWARICADRSEKPTNQESLLTAVKLAADDTQGARRITLLEAMGTASTPSKAVQHAQAARKGPQAIVGIAEQERPDEMDVG